MEGHTVTTNPWLVMAINMTVVFGVLIALGVLMKIIYWVDPTRKKKQIVESGVPAVASAVPAASVSSATNVSDEAVVAAIVGAIVSMGYSAEQIASIRPTITSAKWRMEGRLSGRN